MDGIAVPRDGTPTTLARAADRAFPLAGVASRGPGPAVMPAGLPR